MNQSPYSQDFIAQQKQSLLLEQERIAKELATVATYDEAEGIYQPKFEEFALGESEDNEEAADEVVNFEENTAMTNDLAQSLDEVKVALAKIDKGQYGMCEAGGEWISEERLRAYPAAASCIEHGAQS